MESLRTNATLPFLASCTNVTDAATYYYWSRVGLTVDNDDKQHFHLMLTTRSLGPEGFGKKLRDADGVAFVTQAREGWAAIANAALGKAGANVQIDARSHALRGLDQKPTKHRGPDPAMGEKTAVVHSGTRFVVQ